MSKVKFDSSKILTGGILTTPVIITPNPVLTTIPIGTIHTIPILHTESPLFTRVTLLEGTKINFTRLFSLFPNGLESLPVLPLQAAGYYNDNNDPNRKWYLPDISLKTPAEGGFAFKCYRDGIDGAGKDVYKGTLALRFRKSEPDHIRQLREKPGNTFVFSPIPVPYLSGTITLKIENKDTPVPVNIQIDPAKPDFEFLLPIAKDAIGLWYRTLKETTLGAPLSLEAQFFAWEKPAVPHQIDLLGLAPQARWVGAELVDADNTRNDATLPWQGSEGDARGFARLDTAYMEDNRAYRALRTHPKWVNRGTIKGFFPGKPLPKNARFEAKVGFLSGARFSDGAAFQVWEHHYDAQLKREVWNKIIHHNKPYDGRLHSIVANLSHLEGQNVAIELRVDAGASSGQDWAAWVEPQIKGDEYFKKTVNNKYTFPLSYDCSRYPEFYQFQKSDGAVLSVGCTPPWDANYSPEAPYVAYNKVDLSSLGVSAVYKSILRDDQFLLVPARYVIARDADKLPEIFISVKADLERSENSKALLDIKLAPDISDEQLVEIKKKLVQSWDGGDISGTVELIFPSQVDQVANDNPTITPLVTLNGDENYAHGCGTALKLTLENLSLQNASLLMLNITEALGRNFPFKFKLGGTMAPVPSMAALTFKDFAGSFVIANRSGNTLNLANLFDRDATISNVLVEMPGKTNNLYLAVNQTVKSGEFLSIDIPAAARTGINFAAVYALGVGDPYEIRERNVTTDNIRQDFTADFTAFFKDPDVKTVEITVQMKSSANNILQVFNPARPTGIVTLMLPVGFYLAKRVVDYALRVSYLTPNKAELTRAGKFDLRANSLLVETPGQVDG